MKTLIITPSNIGDVILTTPVITALLENFKGVEIHLLTGPRCRELFNKDPFIKNTLVFIKKAGPGQRLSQITGLRKQRFDLIVDLRHSLLPVLLRAKKRTPFFKGPPSGMAHMRDRHMWRLKTALPDLPDKEYAPRLYIGDAAVEAAPRCSVAMAPGAKSHTKRWPAENFLRLAEMVYRNSGERVILVGDEDDVKISSQILKQAGGKAIDLCGKTGLIELAAVLKKAKLVVSNDSAPMHIGWAVGTPTIGLFGPTDSRKYGPLGPKDTAISKGLDCAPCEKALCALEDKHRCLKEITPEEVFEKIRSVITRSEATK